VTCWPSFKLFGRFVSRSSFLGPHSWAFCCWVFCYWASCSWIFIPGSSFLDPRSWPRSWVFCSWIFIPRSSFRLSDPAKINPLFKAQFMHLAYDWCKSSRVGRAIESYAANYEASSAFGVPRTLPGLTKMELSMQISLKSCESPRAWPQTLLLQSSKSSDGKENRLSV
jgi:hypothetical protein